MVAGGARARRAQRWPLRLRRAIDRRLLPAELSEPAPEARIGAVLSRDRTPPRSRDSASAGAAVRAPARRPRRASITCGKPTSFIASHADEPITLATLASHVGTSPFHLQRTFSRLLGISPRAYQDALRAQRFRRDLRTGKPLTGAIYDAGYGSSSRVYEQRPTGAV